MCCHLLNNYGLAFNLPLLLVLNLNLILGLVTFLFSFAWPCDKALKEMLLQADELIRHTIH